MIFQYSLPAEQKESTKHGEQLFPLQRYITILSSETSTVPAHWHEEAEFTQITEGCCQYQIQLTTYDLHPGDLIFLSPMVLHSIQLSPALAMQSETYVFHMDFLGMNHADICSLRYLTPIATQKLVPPFVIPKEHPAYQDALELFHQISDIYQAKQIGYELRLKALLLQLITILLPYCTESSQLPESTNTYTQKLKLVLEYISLHYDEDLRIADLASLCYFSEYHFMRFFRKHVGMSCVEYIKNIRLQHAAELLTQSEDSTLDVSLSTGFRNLSYFHREFRKKYGMTPKQFRQTTARS